MPDFAEALSPEEWIAFNHIGYVNGQIDKDATANAFAAQLGKRWRGVAGLPWYAQALVAAFILKADQKIDEGDKLLGRLSAAYIPTKGLMLTLKDKMYISKILNDPKMVNKIEDITSKHAFENTAILAILKQGRMEGGVLAPAQFVWLRAVDRDMWYPLNNLGRQTFHAEAAGALSHYNAEVAVGGALIRPKVEAPVRALQHYVSENTIKIPKAEKRAVAKKA